jgi:hypothetical protein
MAAPMPEGIEFRGGSCDGLRNDSESHTQVDGKVGFPDGLFSIRTEHGEAYARTSEEFIDENGRRRVVFRLDPDGSLTTRARKTFAPLSE